MPASLGWPGPGEMMIFFRPLLLYFGHVYLIVPGYLEVRAQLAQILHEIVGE